jgi:hypothetical protein
MVITVTRDPQYEQERAENARRRERRARETAQHKRESGEALLASLFERSADAQAAIARLAEGSVVGEQLAALPRPARGGRSRKRDQESR